MFHSHFDHTRSNGFTFHFRMIIQMGNFSGITFSHSPELHLRIYQSVLDLAEKEINGIPDETAHTHTHNYN